MASRTTICSILNQTNYFFCFHSQDGHRNQQSMQKLSINDMDYIRDASHFASNNASIIMFNVREMDVATSKE